MLILDEHKCIFVHIPKCAGEMVRRQLLERTNAANLFSGIHEHPELGELDYTHIPLKELRDHFPDAYAKLETYRSFALVREPQARFRSSVDMRIRYHLGTQLGALSAKELGRELDLVFAELTAAEGRLLPFSFIHFTPQVHYLLAGDRQVVTDPMPLTRVSDLIETLNGIVGGGLVERRENQSLRFGNPGVERILRRANDVVRQRLPASAYYRARAAVNSILRVDNRSLPAQSPLMSDTVRDFVEHYYARDIEFHDRLSNDERQKDERY